MEHYVHKGPSVVADTEEFSAYAWCMTADEAELAEKKLPVNFLDAIADELVEKGYLTVVRNDNTFAPLVEGPKDAHITVRVKLTVAKNVEYVPPHIEKVEDKS